MALEWVNAYLSAVGTNDPKNFPKSPKEFMGKEDVVELEDEELAVVLKTLIRE